jgi:hypothetical protein
MRSLSVERFTGADGRAMASAIERRIASIRDGAGRPIYPLYDAGAGEAAVNGRADADVEESRIQLKRRFCPGTRDPAAKCEDKAKEEVEISCRRRLIAFESDVRIVRSGDGRLLYARSFPARNESTWCPGDKLPTDAADVISQQIGAAASAVSNDLSPYDAVENIRIREDRKGLPPEAVEAFKTAVRTTKTSGEQACAMFAEIAKTAPDQRAVAFNMALCAEARGDLNEAASRYRAMGGDRDASLAAERVAATRAHDELERRRKGGRL